MAQQGQIHVYNGAFPFKPNIPGKAWAWDSAGGTTNSPWDSGVKYAKDLNSAWIAQRPDNGDYVYVVQLRTIE
jgi:hypothetical protein